MDTGTAIRKIRRNLEVDQSEFANNIGVTQPYLSLIENGHKEPSLKVIRSISEYSGVPIPVIFWLGVTLADVKSDRVDIYNELKPLIDGMLGKVFGK